MARTIAAIFVSLLLGGCVQMTAFQPIYNGTDLTGFTAEGPALWKVENGVIVAHQDPAQPGGGYLVSNHTFHDFELLFEFRIVPHNGNSGVIIRDPTRGRGDPAKYGYEIQIHDQYDVAFPTGSIYGVDASLDPVQHADWNEMRIVSFKEWLRVDLNKKKVCEKKVERQAAAPIMFQCYGGRGNRLTRVYFRAIQVRPLYFAPEEFAGKYEEAATGEGKEPADAGTTAEDATPPPPAVDHTDRKPPEGTSGREPAPAPPPGADPDKDKAPNTEKSTVPAPPPSTTEPGPAPGKKEATPGGVMPPPPGTEPPTPEEKPPTPTPEEKPPTPTPEEKPPAPTPEEKPPAPTPEEKPPTPTPEEKPPTLQPEEMEPPAPEPEEKPPEAKPAEPLPPPPTGKQ